jgi:biopolymer transport protein ExbD
MAEINLPAGAGGKPGVRRSKKLSTRVDLTPMVDLGFLLITFFIFTTTMSTPKATKLVMSKDSKDSTQAGMSTALTVLPYKNNQHFYYHGELGEALKTGTYGITSYSVSDGIGQVIRNKQAALDNMQPDKHNDLVLMIKPMPESNYENLVNVIDEVLINAVQHYAIMDVTDAEKKVVTEKIK